MAPPRKRRRLSQSVEERDQIPAYDFSPAETTAPALELPATRAVPQRIEEIHVRIQQVSAPVTDHAGQHKLHRRQGSGVESIISTVNAAGSSVLSTITSVSQSESSSQTASASKTESGSTIASSSVSPSFKHTTLFPSLSLSSISVNGTYSSSSAPSTTLPLTYLATLTNKQIKTITRATKPYVTSFGDGQTSTICDRFGQCHMSTPTSSVESTSLAPIFQTPLPQGSTSVAIPASAGSGATTSASPSSSTTGASKSHTSNTTTPPPATIAGGVVGGAAGIAIVLLIVLALLRWYKRNGQHGHRALPASSSMASGSRQGEYQTHSGMVERAGLSPLVNAMPALFRHQNKSSEEPAATERSFTKVSGRKLPSAFSEGMTRDDILSSQAPSMSRNASNRDLTGTSFYRDSRGFYGGPGESEPRSVSPDAGPFADQMPAAVSLSPGPQRRPTVHAPGPYTISAHDHLPRTPDQYTALPASGQALSPRGFSRGDMASHSRSATPTGRSGTPSSRFTEEV